MPEYLFRDEPALPIDIVGAKDSYLFDKSGRKYLDKGISIIKKNFKK